MKNAAGQQVDGLGRTLTLPRAGEVIQLNLTPKEKCGRRFRLQLNDPLNLIEDVEIIRKADSVIVPV